MNTRYKISLIAGAVLISGAILLAPDKYEPLMFNGREIHILYTDDNTNEDIILHMDNENYGGSGTMYVSAKNTVDDQTVYLSGLFSEEVKYSIVELNPRVPVIERYKECDAGYEETGEPIMECKEELVEKERTVYKDQVKKIAKDNLDKTTVETIRRKDVGRLEPKGHFSIFIKKNETKFFAIHFESSGGIQLGESNPQKFGVEAIGSLGAYGLIDPWYDSNWNYRVKVTVDSSQVSADLTDYPVYVNLNNLPAGFHTNVNQTDGRDIRVTKSDGTTEVPREVVFYTAADDTGELHFKASGTLSSSTDTDFYIYYGNSSATEPAADATYGSQNVWGTATGVWHLSTTTDSTVNANNGTAAGDATATTSGKVGSAFTFDGTGDQVNLQNGATYLNDDFTISMWVKNGALNENHYPFSSYEGAGGAFVTIRYLDNFDRIIFAAGDGTSLSYIRAEDLNWHLITVTRKSSDGATIIYSDGASRASGTQATGSLSSSNNYPKIGTSNNTLNFNGLIDNVRIYTSILSADWIAAEYTNQNTPTTFYTVGSQEEDSGGVVEDVAGEEYIIIFE